MKSRLFITLTALASIALVFNTFSAEAKPRKSEVKNIILMIGDGMGTSQITQYMVENRYKPINMQRATGGGMITTYSANNRVTDSAAAATAYATGQKTNNSKLSVDPKSNDPMPTILEKAEKAGLATGVVATCYLTHATPAAFYAHSKGRYSNDTIAAQMIRSGIDIAFGGGDKIFTDRKDGRNLLEEAAAIGYNVADNIDDLKDCHKGNHIVAYPTGKNHMPAWEERGDYLPRATAKALEILSNNSRKGFFVMIEGSLIDYGGHGNSAKITLDETRDFDQAVGVAMDFADNHPGTLVIILADHETGGMTIVSNNEDFTESESGVKYRFSTGGHSGTMVPLLTYGAGANTIGGIYDNTEIFDIMCQKLGLE